MISGVSDAIFWNVVTYKARLVQVGNLGKYNNGDVSVGSGQRISVNIGEIERVSPADNRVRPQ